MPLHEAVYENYSRKSTRRNKVQSSRRKEMSSQCNVDSSKFSEPLPWIGLYIVGASFLCSLLMGLDTFLGFRRQKLWFPCRWFSLNATSLTLVSVATKLPVDLNTSMPRPQDQLTKLSGTVLICTVMGNFMTSLGTMDGSEMISNIVALGILVVTVIVNIGIQMGTGVIYVFLPEHAVIMFLMLVLLVMLCSTAIMIPTAKKLLEEKYNEKFIDAKRQKRFDEKQLKKYDTELREYVKKHWMMAHTSSPQYVVGRSETCTASGALCLLGALIFLQAAVRSFIKRSLAFCDGKSDYTWSMTLVFISQAIAIVVGTFAPAIRLFNSINFRSPKCKFEVEEYWVQKLVEWKESLLPFDISSRGLRKFSYISRNQILNVFKGMQYAVVIVSKLIWLTFILPVSCLSSQSGSDVDFNSYAIHLDGENTMVPLINTSARKDTQHWIGRGKDNQSSKLIELLESSAISKGFQGVEEFDSDRVPLSSTELPSLLDTKPRDNCWALPIVTLTSIAIAIAPPSLEKRVKLLQCGVHDSLKYIRLVEETLDGKGLKKMREAADIVWLGIDICDCWLDMDLKKLAREKTAIAILNELVERAKHYVREKEKDPDDHWPHKVLAAQSMYRLCETFKLKNRENADQMFEWLQKAIAEIVAACLTNLPRVISITCACNSIETTEEKVRDAAYLLGETEEILKMLEMVSPPKKPEKDPYTDDDTEIPENSVDYPGQYIEDWISTNTAEP